MRLFTAIDLPEEIRDRLAELIGRLRPLASVQWSPPENLHITTKFIGEWPVDRLPEVGRKLAGLAGGRAIAIRIGGLGFFPNAKSPRVFWAGVEAGPALALLAGETDRALGALGVQPETRPYSPHLTLARIRKDPAPKPFYEAIARLGAPEFGSFSADRFFLYLSKPGPRGSVYTKLSEFPIATS